MIACIFGNDVPHQKVDVKSITLAHPLLICMYGLESSRAWAYTFGRLVAASGVFIQVGSAREQPLGSPPIIRASTLEEAEALALLAYSERSVPNPAYFAGNRGASTIFVESPGRVTVPFGDPRYTRLFTGAAYPFTSWGYATTKSPPHLLRGADLLVATSRAAHDWCRIVVGRPTKYDRQLEIVTKEQYNNVC